MHISIGATLMYWIIRLGVKHGLYSYFVERSDGSRTPAVGSSSAQA